MSKQGNLLDMPLLSEEVEKALCEYELAPQSGLKKLRTALLYLNKHQPPNLEDSLLSQKMSSIEGAIDRLILSSSPYSADFHHSFLSAFDAVFQIIYAAQISEERIDQLVFLLSNDRSCWHSLKSIVDYSAQLPDLKSYEAHFDLKKIGFEFEALLERLSRLGSVSFQVTSANDNTIIGRLVLETVQTLAWLKAHYRVLDWQLVFVEKSIDLRELCESSYLPLFQHDGLEVSTRNKLLTKYETQLKGSFYQEFELTLPDHVARVTDKRYSRLVPCFDTVLPDEISDGGFPVRHGGAFYLGAMDVGNGRSEVQYRQCLGRDYLSSFLFEFDVGESKVVFDCGECLRLDTALFVDIEKSDESNLAFIVLSNEQKVPLVTHVFGSNVLEYIEQASVSDSFNIALIEQVGECFALPYLSKRDIEAVPAFMAVPKTWFKNVWLSKNNDAFLEPWLFEYKSLSYLSCLPAVEVFQGSSQSAGKSGYYAGQLFGKDVWVEASLIRVLTPCLDVHFFDSFDGNEAIPPFVVYEGQCFDQVLLGAKTLQDKPSKGFSVILEWRNQSVILFFQACNWYASLPFGYDTQDFFVPSTENGRMIEEVFSSIQEEFVVINKNNFTSLVGGIWPPSLSIEKKG
ncbi:hypothetical protein OFY17_00720 [Marinomonas sp. C2222]|uniref:TerD domain-containing protein n=1 Tax=Marinomonas sargassi TaxID=2984494 RepID=A0ABT2YND3_9GAMM|nr:hypothetical protein [Marinomonas sargassi]MCV2401392.1 hypothetical protein [Marinomonas sargassi]